MEPTTAREPLLTASDLADQLGIPTSTLANWRYQGRGPRYLRIGRHIRYHPDDVDEWLRARRSRHTPSLR